MGGSRQGVGMSQLAHALRREIEDVHAFIASWFRGDLIPDDAVFDNGLCARMAAELVNIQPSGQVLTRSDLVDGIRAGHGSNSNFRISISDVVLRWVGDGKALVTYVEFQQGARQTVPADNRRISSVLFDLSGERPLWLHIHETGLD